MRKALLVTALSLSTAISACASPGGEPGPSSSRSDITTTQPATENQATTTYEASPETCSLLLIIQSKLGSVGTSTVVVRPAEVGLRYPVASMRRDAKSLNYSQTDEDGMVPVNDPTIAVSNAANSLRTVAWDLENPEFGLTISDSERNEFIQEAVIIPDLDLARSDVDRAIALNCPPEGDNSLG